jgi:hypothetical protein
VPLANQRAKTLLIVRIRRRDDDFSRLTRRRLSKMVRTYLAAFSNTEIDINQGS